MAKVTFPSPLRRIFILLHLFSAGIEHTYVFIPIHVSQLTCWQIVSETSFCVYWLAELVPGQRKDSYHQRHKNQIRNTVIMGAQPSSEAHGAKCVECGVGLPRNNWSFEHLGRDGWVYVFYSIRHDDVQVSEALELAVASSTSDSASLKAGFSTGRTMREVKVLDYIRNSQKDQGYTCLNCLKECCERGFAGWDRILKETNSLLRSHGIMVETARIQTIGGSFAFLSRG